MKQQKLQGDISVLSKPYRVLSSVTEQSLAAGSKHSLILLKSNKMLSDRDGEKGF